MTELYTYIDTLYWPHFLLWIGGAFIVAMLIENLIEQWCRRND